MELSGKAYIILLNYNGTDNTYECLQSLDTLYDTNYQVIVIDNHSRQAEYDKLLLLCKDRLVQIHDEKDLESAVDDKDDELVILRTSQNNGYNAGFNAGLKYISIRGGDYDCAWFLNNDILVNPYALTALRERQKKTGAAGIGSVICDAVEKKQVQYVGSRWVGDNFEIKGVFAGVPYCAVEENESIDCLPGPAFLLTKDFINKIHLFEERYFLYCEESELAECARLFGARFTYAKDSIVYHKGSCTTNNSCVSFRDYHLARSHAIFLSKWHPDCLPLMQKKVFLFVCKQLKHLHIKRAWAALWGMKKGMMVGR